MVKLVLILRNKTSETIYVDSLQAAQEIVDARKSTICGFRAWERCEDKSQKETKDENQSK